MNRALTQAIEHWKYIQPIVAYPQNEKEAEELIFRLDELLDVVGDDEKHPLMGLVDILSNLIEAYEDTNHPIPAGKKGIDALKFLMDSHQLHQSDLPEIGSQGVISELLNKKRTLNIRQIKLLARRFHVTPSTFLN